MYEPKHCEVITGDLLACPDEMIVHQCNCMNTGVVGGIAGLIFARHPEADPHRNHPGVPSEPGSAEFCVSPFRPIVANLYGQVNPGGPSEDPGDPDHPDARYNLFKQALRLFGNTIIGVKDEIWRDRHDEVTIGFPWQIGCGIAGGDWDGRYFPLIDRFAGEMAAYGFKVHIYKLPE